MSMKSKEIAAGGQARIETARVQKHAAHTAHGMGAQSATFTGERMVNFDVSVVAPNATPPISYSQATGTCSLVRHGHTHK